MAVSTPHGAYFLVSSGYWVFDRTRDRWTLWRNFDGRFFTGKVKTTRGHSARYDRLHHKWRNDSARLTNDSG